jgi:capsular exopolysaccharide synthesis family protein
MSEIFDFLKKTEKESKKGVRIPEPVAMEPLAEFQEAPFEEQSRVSMAEEPAPMEVEICAADRFDLTQASLQIKNVMDPLSLVGEQFRLLRSRLGLMQKQRGIKVILVTSTLPNEGKTFTASGLVGVFAQEPGKRVLLIDADMRKPKSGWSLGLNGSTVNSGLSEVLRGNVQFHNALLTSTNPEFCFLPAGPLPSNPSELLGSPILERILKAACEKFDWIILDSPPVLSLSDTTILTALCDSVVLVLRANSTPSKLVEDAINRIGRDRICGIAINRQKRIRSSRYYYQYYYSSSKPPKG